MKASRILASILIASALLATPFEPLSAAQTTQYNGYRGNKDKPERKPANYF